MRREGWAWAAAVLAAAVLAGCGPHAHPRVPGGDSAGDSSFAGRSFQHARSPQELAASRGAVVYARYCGVCHGAGGGGDGFNAYGVRSTFGVGPAAFTDPAFSARPAREVARAIALGGPAVGKSPAMPPWGRTLAPGDLADVACFVRALR